MIRAGVYYPRLITENPPLRAFVKAPLPQAEKATKEVLSLPIHPALSHSATRPAGGVSRSSPLPIPPGELHEDDLGRIIKSIRKFYG
jgi:hypothetical protein